MRKVEIQARFGKVSDLLVDMPKNHFDNTSSSNMVIVMTHMQVKKPTRMISTMDKTLIHDATIIQSALLPIEQLSNSYHLVRSNL